MLSVHLFQENIIWQKKTQLQTLPIRQTRPYTILTGGGEGAKKLLKSQVLQNFEIKKSLFKDLKAPSKNCIISNPFCLINCYSLSYTPITMDYDT